MDVTGVKVFSATKAKEREILGEVITDWIRVNGQNRRLTRPSVAVRSGIGMAPGERRLGLVMNLSVRENILLPSLDRLTRAGSLDRAAGNRLVSQLMESLDIRPRNAALPSCRRSVGQFD